MQAMDQTNISPNNGGSNIVVAADDGSGARNTLKSIDDLDIKDSMITGRGPPEKSVDSPTLSPTSSDSDEIIDHTAALLGFMEELDDDDMREISGFSPAVSLDLELEPIGDEKERNARFEQIFSGDELDGGEVPAQRARSVMPMKLNLTPASGKKVTLPQKEFQDNGAPVQLERDPKASNGKSRKSLAEDVPFFYFDSTLVAQAVEEYGQRKRTDIDNKRKQAALKAKALKEKASSAISLKAKKAASAPQAILSKVRKSHDEIEQHVGEDGELSLDEKSASSVTAMKLKAIAAFNERAKKAKERMSVKKAIKGRRNMTSNEGSVNESESFDTMFSMYSGGMKMPTIPTVAPMREYMEGIATKTGITVIGDINKLVKQSSFSNPPAIATCPSTVSSNNSQVIDEAGFIISPTSSIDLISPVVSPKSTASTKGAANQGKFPPTIASPKSVTSAKSSRGELPPAGRNLMASQNDQKKEPSGKMTLNICQTQPRNHRRTTTASF